MGYLDLYFKWPDIDAACFVECLLLSMTSDKIHGVLILYMLICGLYWTILQEVFGPLSTENNATYSFLSWCQFTKCLIFKGEKMTLFIINISYWHIYKEEMHVLGTSS